MVVESALLLELGIVLGIAAILALVGRAIRQPTLIAYLITGVIVGPLVLGVLKSTEIVGLFSSLGIAFLLFIVGLSLDFRVLKEVGKVATTVGILQVIITSTIGFFIAVAIGISYTPALFLAAALSISSTVFVVKLLTDKKEIDSLHGKIAIGILIVQDFIAAALLLLIPILSTTGDLSLIVQKLGIGAVLILGVFIFTHIIIPGILSIAARNQEVLLLFSIGWALLIAILFEFLGYSVEMGALIAGMSLASSKFSLEIGSKIKGLREFFVIVHLIFFGSLLAGPITSTLITNAVIFSAVVLIGTPLIVMTSMKFFGYKKRTSFMTGLSIAQVSEFSLILIFIGFTLGVVTQEILSLTILVALITIGINSFAIYYSKQIYRMLSWSLGIFDNPEGIEPGTKKKNFRHEIILFGYNRIGFNLVKSFEKIKKKFLVVDYNPETISRLSKKGINCIYGDATDMELIKLLDLQSKKVIISTIPDLDTNLGILKHIKDRKTIFIPTAHHIEDAQKLYEEGADYVVMPHFIGGDYLAHMLTRDKFNKKEIDKEGKKQMKELEERMFEGHTHPTKDDHGE